MMKKILLLFISILLSVTAKADYEDDFTVWIGGILYSLYEQPSEGVYEAVVINPVENSKNYEGDIVIPSQFLYDEHYYTVIGIGERAFVYNQMPGGGNTFVSPLTSIALPNTVKYIGKEAFSGCNSLTSIVIPNSVTTIEESVFAGCTSLTSVIIPNSVLTIGEKAFYGCTGLTSATLSSKVSDIGDKAFYGCNNLATVTARGIKPAHITSDVFPNRLSQTLYVPKGRKSVYEDADYWWQFKNIIDKAMVTVNNKNRPYGDENPDFDVSIEGGELQGEINISCEATKESPVGMYDVTATLAGADLQDFIVINGALYVEKAPLVISAGNYTLPANESMPYFEPIYEGFKNGENESVLTKIPEVYIKYVSGEEMIPDEQGDWREPGTTFILSVRGAEAQNYNIGYVDGYLYITDRASHLVVAELQDVTRPYGEENPTFEYTIVEGSEYFNEQYIHFYCEADEWSPVGTYEIIMTIDPSIPGREVPFDLNGCMGTLTIEPAPLKVIAEDCERNQYEENPEFTIRYEGFKLEEDEDVLDVKPVATTTATPNSEPGVYEITVSGGEAENYEFEYQNGKLTILGESATESYLAISQDGKVATFYYDNLKGQRSGTVLDLDGYQGLDDAAAELVTKAVFDPSFASARPTTTYRWFYNMKNLASIEGIEHLNTSEVTTMQSMFNYCSSLASVNVSGFNTSKVTAMQYMFYFCSSLTNLDLSNFNTSEVNSMRSMFNGCSSLASVNVSGFNTSKVTSMEGMFHRCSSLTSLDLSNFNTSNVTTTYMMFNKCSGLTSLDVSSFDTSKASDTRAMFGSCSGLKSFTISGTMGNLDSKACNGVGTKSDPCRITAPEGFDFGDVNVYDTFQWKGGWFDLGYTDLCALTASAATLRAGETADLSIGLAIDGERLYNGYQFDVTLPEGITLAKEDRQYVYTLADRYTDNMLVSFNEIGDSKWRVMVYSLNNALLTGLDGDVITLSITAGEDIAEGDYSGSISNIRLSRVDNNAVHVPGIPFVIHVAGHAKGDANHDGVVDISDVMLTVYKALAKPVNGFHMDEADINGDGEIDIVDVMSIVYIMLGKTVSSQTPKG